MALSQIPLGLILSLARMRGQNPQAIPQQPAGMVNPQVPSPDMRRANELINQNLGLNFVQRLLEPQKWPVINNPDGSHSTHLMAWDQDKKGPFVFPTIVWDGKRLKKMSADEAWHHAQLTGELIRVNSPEEAEWFSNHGYKLGAGMGLPETTKRGAR